MTENCSLPATMRLGATEINFSLFSTGSPPAAPNAQLPPHFRHTDPVIHLFPQQPYSFTNLTYLLTTPYAPVPPRAGLSKPHLSHHTRLKRSIPSPCPPSAELLPPNRRHPSHRGQSPRGPRTALSTSRPPSQPPHRPSPSARARRSASPPPPPPPMPSAKSSKTITPPPKTAAPPAAAMTERSTAGASS